MIHFMISYHYDVSWSVKYFHFTGGVFFHTAKILNTEKEPAFTRIQFSPNLFNPI